MGIVTATSETAFARSPEVIYDFVTNPVNWTAPLPDALFEQVNPAKIDAYHAAIARELDALDDGAR